MARRRSRSTPRPLRPDLAVVLPRRPLRPLSLLEDRRRFHPERDLRPALSFFGKPRLVVRKARKAPARSRMTAFSGLSHRIGFQVPKRVAICVRRKERREVLIANGAGGSRKPKRRNYWSSIQC